MFSHVTVGVTDLDRAAAFYDAVLRPLGYFQRPVTPDGGPASRCWVDGPPGPRPHYGNGYFGAYLHDRDGNKIHIVHRGDLI
jgi:hypothetical protein